MATQKHPPTDDSIKLTLTVEECAKVCGISRTLAYTLARRGELPGVLRLGRRLLVSRAALDHYLAAPPVDDLSSNS